MEPTRPPLPDELWIHIVKLLSKEDIANCPRVCRKWYGLCNDQEVMKSLLSRHGYQEAVDDLSSLATIKVISWKEIPKLAPLSTLFHEIFETYHASSMEIKQDNLGCEIVHPMIKRGSHTFTITKHFQIAWRKNGNLIELLSGAEDECFTHLAIDENSLFALNTRGFITRWDLIHKERVICIRTKRTKKITTCDSPSFIVQEGTIALFLNHRKMEIIPYKDPDSRFEVMGRPMDSKVIPVIHQGKLYLGSKKSVQIFNLKSKEWETQLDPEADPPLDIHDMSVQEGVILTCDGVATITLYSIKERKLIKRRHYNASYSFSNPSVKWTHHVMIKNLFFGFGIVETSRKVVTIINLNTWKIVGIIENLFNLDKMTLNAENMANLAICCRTNLSELAIES